MSNSLLASKMGFWAIFRFLCTCPTVIAEYAPSVSGPLSPTDDCVPVPDTYNKDGFLV